VVFLANDKLILTLVIILVVDVLLFFSQVGIAAVQSDYSVSGGSIFYDNESFIQQFNVDGSGGYLLSSNSSGVIPEASDSVSTETGNLFTDSARSLKSWFSKATGSIVTGWDYFTGFLGGPVHYFNNVNAPPEFVFGFGALWYGLTLLLLILLIFNR